MEVDFIPFNHEARMFYPEQVLGHILYPGGRKIMYTGDAEVHPENWRPYDLKSRHIDMALVPFWLFKEEIAKTIIEKHVAPEEVVVGQIPLEGMREKLSALSQRFPDVVFLSRPWHRPNSEMGAPAHPASAISEGEVPLIGRIVHRSSHPDMHALGQVVENVAPLVNPTAVHKGR